MQLQLLKLVLLLVLQLVLLLLLLPHLPGVLKDSGWLIWSTTMAEPPDDTCSDRKHNHLNRPTAGGVADSVGLHTYSRYRLHCLYTATGHHPASPASSRQVIPTLALHHVPTVLPPVPTMPPRKPAMPPTVPPQDLKPTRMAFVLLPVLRCPGLAWPSLSFSWLLWLIVRRCPGAPLSL